MEIKVTGRILPLSEDTIRRNPELFKNQSPMPLPVIVEAKGKAKRFRQSEKPLLNKLETEAFEMLKRSHPEVTIHPQAKRYKLANGLWYKPDFTATVKVLIDPVIGNTLYFIETAWEVKGPHAFKGAFEVLKMAATQWPEVAFIMLWKEGGEWKSQRAWP